MFESSYNRFYGGNEDALKCIAFALQDAQLIRIATAYFEASGFQCLREVLTSKNLLLLIGREQGGKDSLIEVINEFADSLSAGTLINRTSAMRQMLDALEKGQLLVGVGDDPIDHTTYLEGRYLYQHAKLYIADEKAVVVTSANMSAHGLVTSREAGNTVTNPEHVYFFVDQFDKYYKKAKSITNDFIDKLRAHLEAYDPYIIYARALLELYNLPKDAVPPQLPSLADYQRPAVTRVKNNIEEHGGAMLIASTGLGKTVIAAHIVAYLRMEGLIDSVIIICPAGLRETWRRFMRASRTSSIEFSYHTLSADDYNQSRDLLILEHEIRQTTEKTLIIVDESHQLRNDDGGERLRNQRISEAVRTVKAKLLMMTATPFSKNIKDVNNQLELLPEPSLKQITELQFYVESKHWKVNDSSALSELPPCFVLTTPTVVKYFSYLDEQGERYVLFSRNDRRYFPRHLKLRTILYENLLDGFLLDLLQSKLLNNIKISSDEEQPSLFDLNDIELMGKRNPLFESLLVHQFCSSPIKVRDVYNAILQNSYKMNFARHKELVEFIHRYESTLDKALTIDGDHKLKSLLQVIEEANGEKIVVFCIYKETAFALVKQIREALPMISVETTAGHKAEKVDSILKNFAPIANDVPEDMQSNPIQVLIATGALAEGFNLQDAAILVNYDLPWTVLHLAQRMGRILRPWHTPREIIIYNLIPSTMNNIQLYMAQNWQKRLINYSEEHRSFAEIPVLLKSGSQGEDWEMIELAKGLYHFNEVDLDLDEVMNFVENSENLQTTSFYNDLARIPLQQVEEIRNLPPGIRTGRLVKGSKQLFILFKHRNKFYPALFDKGGKLKMGSENPDAIMKNIQCEIVESRAPFTIYPTDDEFDDWLETAKTNWADTRNIIDKNSIQVTCAMALLPADS